MALSSRDRLQATLDHHQPDRAPVDFGATAVTGMHVSAVARLRRAVLGEPNYRVKVIEPYQMLGEIDEELRLALGIDVAGVRPRCSMFGFENKEWKPLTLFDGTDVLVPGDFRVTEAENGDWLIHPRGDLSAPPRGRMPKGGYFFDAIVRQEPIVEEELNPADNTEEFVLLGEEDLAYYRHAAQWLDEHSNAGAILTIPGAGFGDIALVPAPWLKHPRGIRDVEEWYVSTVARREYVRAVFERQCEIALQNIETLIGLFGDRIQAAFVSGTDFGSQRGPFIAPAAYRDLFMPFHRRVTDLIHRRSRWKTFIHSCGSVRALIPSFLEAGFDILNPVQCSAADMAAQDLKREFGDRLSFWGGGVDTQKTMAFGSADDVYRETRERIQAFGAGGGFVFNAVHNIQATTPTENIMAMFRAIQGSRI